MAEEAAMQHAQEETMDSEGEAPAPSCNFCLSSSFEAVGGREGEKCANCGALRRHRVALEVYRRHGLCGLGETSSSLRVLHLLPEAQLRREITAYAGTGYLMAEFRPSRPKAAQTLRLDPDDPFWIFPDDYFDFVLHNHALIYMPGQYRDTLAEIARILKPGGHHIFSVPGPDMGMDTQEGGEHLDDDARQQTYGKYGHIKRMGKDLIETLKGMPGGQFRYDDLSNEDRARIGVTPGSNRLLLWRKGRARAAKA
jgi:SAM-dependent methyltransferase